MQKGKSTCVIRGMLRALFVVIMVCWYSIGWSQDRGYVQRVVSVLASDSMGGRGYRDGADLRAAEYIRSEFVRHGVAPVGQDYFQPVVFSVNSITSVNEVSVDGVALTPGEDFYISSRSRGRRAEYTLVWVDRSTLLSRRKMRRLSRSDLSGSLLVLAPDVPTDPDTRAIFRRLFWDDVTGYHKTNAAGIVYCQQRPGWQISDSGSEQDYLVLTVRCGLVDRDSRTVVVDFGSEFVQRYRSQNVLGMIPGTQYPDSVIVFTAHYDHLGMMGDVIIPGANDNASGTAMMLDLARYYADHPPAWTVVFMAFTAEEAGLIGSRHYVKAPWFPLERIVSLVNLDMVGTGSEGITVVNGSVHPTHFAKLDSINRADSLLAEVRIRGESPNSDHHPFHAVGVRAFFIYTMGPEHREYHNIYDRAEALSWAGYDGLFLLLTRYAELLMR